MSRQSQVDHIGRAGVAAFARTRIYLGMFDGPREDKRGFYRSLLQSIRPVHAGCARSGRQHFAVLGSRLLVGAYDSLNMSLSFHWHPIAAGRAGPGPRSRHCIWHDSHRKATVLFGGLVWQSGGAASFPADTWELHGERWYPLAHVPSPSPRHRAAAAFDSGRGVAVLFGGQSPGGFMKCDTWLYEDSRWRRKRFWRGPGPRCGHMMAYDEAAGRVVLFGGINPGDCPLGDTWLFDGAWHISRGAGPSPRRYAAFAYDPDLGGCVLHGGAQDDAGAVTYGDAWLFRESRWGRLAEGFSTRPRDDHGLAYHRAARRLVMFGGLSGGSRVLYRDNGHWQEVSATPLPPLFQCAPMTYDDQLGGIVLHGGESRHGGPQLDATLVLRVGSAI